MAIFSLYNEIWEVSLLKYKINIIDDEKHLNDIVRTYLEKEGYECTSFYTYDEALMHLQNMAVSTCNSNVRALKAL